MRIALICPSNLLYMPYVGNYKKILIENHVDYEIINWDRFKIEGESKFIYRDSKNGPQRGFLDYFKYSMFVLDILKKSNYDKIVIFNIQLMFFLKKYLIKNYKNKYIFDIRDYNRILKYFNIKKPIDNSAFTVLSSLGYKEWLPKRNNYTINHNTSIENIDELKDVRSFVSKKTKKISVGCIGALRDYNINIDFINSFKNNPSIEINYHGEGDINKDLSKYLIEHSIKYVNLTGRYLKGEEEGLYSNNDIINVLRYNDCTNNRTALPNRLYNAVFYGKPLLAFEGTYLADVIEKYGLGLTVNSLENIENVIIDYIQHFNTAKYEINRLSFFSEIIYENNAFLEKLRSFVYQNEQHMGV